MAAYRKPEDPRKTGAKIQVEEREPIPWAWLGMGVVVALVGVGIAALILNAFLQRDPLTAVAPLEPTIIILTAPPEPTPTPTLPFATPTVLPTLTPVPTADIFNPPDEIAPGYYAVVSNTGGFGVTIRGGPSTNNIRLLVANDGTYMIVLEGPVAEEGADRLWWRVRLLDGTEGWVAGDFIELAPPPQ